MMDSAKKAIKERIESGTIEEAREFVATYHGSKGSEYQVFAEDCLATKEATLRDAHGADMLSIVRKSLTINASENKKWYKKPFGIIVLGATGSLLAWIILRFFRLV